MDWLLGPLGLTIESQAEGYSRRLKDDRSGLKEWNAGDMLKDVLTPGTREDLEEAARKLETGRINKSTTSDRELIRQTLGNTNIDVSDQTLKVREGETVDDYKARLAGLTTTGQANVNNTGIEGYDPSKVVNGMTATGVAQLGTAQNKTNRETKENKIEAKDERRYRDSQDLIALQFANSSADRQADREYRRDQQAYQNRKLDMQEARLDRKDRQAAIQSMMAGLAQLGASIAI
jgi:hypothetical protein